MKQLLDEIVELENQSVEITRLDDTYTHVIYGVRIGKLTSVKEIGQILVDYHDNPFGSLKAQSAIDIASEDINKRVLLAFDNNNPKLPIIIGFIRDNADNTVTKIMAKKNEVKDIIMDGKRMVFDADKEIELRCGKSSLIMKKDGRIVIKGTQIVSRANGVNKIKGAAVRIN